MATCRLIRREMDTDSATVLDVAERHTALVEAAARSAPGLLAVLMTERAVGRARAEQGNGLARLNIENAVLAFGAR
jgi:hypothetical protein